MATEEKSRDAFDPTKRYAAVGMQLGRVLVDDDVNEGERIRLEDERRVQLDVIGPVGSPDDGLRVSHGHLTGGRCDFDLGAGTLYLGGLRLWNPTTRTFALQDDWLQQATADRPALVVDRTDLVYVEAWQQPVTAVEDSELFEVALGGPDTSTRLRTMYRVRIAPGVAGGDCPSAWTALVDGWTTAGLGTIDATGERRVDAELTLTYTGGATGDLCTPAIASGYLGAENQTLRVQLVDATHLTWGFDNAAPIYRATVNPAGTTLTLQTDPRDQAHWPTTGQVVEILPWSALLANGEKLAEESGHLSRVASSFDPVSRQVVLDATLAVPAGFGTAWQGRGDAAALAPAYVFVRIWNRGDDHTSAPAIPFVPGTPLTLGSTGLRIQLDGSHRLRGDHWVIAARPRTPDQVVPWALEDGRGVHGSRRFFAPLALVTWKGDGSFDVVHDCRPHFLPLTRLRGCCTYTVGDEIESFGKFSSIQAAVDALPAAGGKVCLLPGTYTETVTLLGKQGVTIEGCGPRSRWRPASERPWALLVVGGRDLAVRAVAIEAGLAFGIVLLDAAKPGSGPTSLADAAWSGFSERLTRVRLEELRIETAGRSAIAAIGGVDVTIRGCELVASPLAQVMTAASDLGRWPSILSFADDVVIADNRILARREDREVAGALNHQGQVTFTRTALGGIQLGGGSERVQVLRNHVEGGNGDGVTLGSWAWAPRRVIEEGGSWDQLAEAWNWLAGITVTINPAGCIEIGWDPDPPDDPQVEWVPVSMGPVFDVTIVDNRIRRMGRSGVGVARFFDLARRDEIIAVHGLDIRANRIDECLVLGIPLLPVRLREVAAAGVITLAEVSDLRVRGNRLERNGKSHVDPVCGVFALVSTGAVIEHNRILDNAPRDPENDEPARAGWRGGVVLPRATPPTVTIVAPGLGERDQDPSILRQDGQPAARIADNVIVVPEGRPVVILGSGPMVIRDNHLVTRGVGRADLAQLLAGGAQNLIAALQSGQLSVLLDLLGGVAALVVDLGMANELGWLQLLFYLSLRDQELNPGPGLDPRPPVAASGNVMFAGNQVNVDLIAAPNNVVLTAVALFSLDDVVVADNQIEFDRGLDPVLFTVVPYAMTTRVQGNRVKEAGVPTERFLTGASILSIGALLNITTGNQTTRCIAVMGLREEHEPNQVMYEIFHEELCTDLRELARVIEGDRLITPAMRVSPKPAQPVTPAPVTPAPVTPAPVTHATDPRRDPIRDH